MYPIQYSHSSELLLHLFSEGLTMTLEQLKLSKKYLDEYTQYCKDRECGEGCPVFDAHKLDPKTSCFMIYCQMREAGKL